MMFKRLLNRGTVLIALSLLFLTGGVRLKAEEYEGDIVSPKSACLRIHATKTTAWRVALIDVNKDGQEEVVYAGYGGSLICQDLSTKRVLWRTDIGGFPYCLKVADLDGDGDLETLVSSSSLNLYTFSSQGKLLWKFSCGYPILSFDVARKNGKTMIFAGGNGRNVYVLDSLGKQLKRIETSSKLSATRVLSGDIIGDSSPEMFIMNQYGHMKIIDPLVGKSSKIDMFSRATKSACLWDVDGDDKSEILRVSGNFRVYEKGNIIKFYYELILFDGTGKRLWKVSKVLQPGTMNLYYPTPQLALFDFTEDGKKEIAVLLGPELCIFDGNGKLLYSKSCLEPSFTDLSASQETNTLVLGSIVGGSDKSIYLLTFKRAKKDQFESFTTDHGHYLKIRKNLQAIHDYVISAKPDLNAPKRNYRFHITGRHGGLRKRLQEIYPYKNITFLAVYGAAGDPIKKAKNFETGKLDHIILGSHGINRGWRNYDWLTVDGLEKYLNMTKTTCHGVAFAETSALFMPTHDQKASDYVDEVMIPFMDLCLKYKKDIYLWEKQAWWALVPARKIYRRIFDEKYWSYIIARTEESNSRCPELNLMARVGLFRTGIVKEWSANMISDLWRAYTTWILEYEYKDASAILRQLVAYASAGATDFRLQYDFHLKAGSGEVEYRSQIGNLVLDTFIHMLGKGILIPPTPEEIVGLSPVVIRFHEPHKGILWNVGGNWEHFDIDEEAQDGLFSGYHWWGLRPSHPYYFSSYILNVKRYGHHFIPETPYGLPIVVPHWVPEEKLKWATKIIDTDGVYVLEKGKKFRASAKKEEILSKFSQGSEELLFSAKGIYNMGRRNGVNSYRVTLVDPGIFSPGPMDRDVRLRVGKRYKLKSAYDVIKGKKLKVSRRFVDIRVPAGAFRILDIVVEE